MRQVNISVAKRLLRRVRVIMSGLRALLNWKIHEPGCDAKGQQTYRRS